ncbi:MAG: 2-amino-4-hydroxy-6-hydroxymethyldihydropteridine diphosphokinase [Colwellia sp.]|nr:2-amino-4-hydroxy-6-hydroxymethyldihydropteridine diphosphokinase [Colwellia sp.]
MSKIYISLGSNIEREYHIKCGLEALARIFDLPFQALTLSSLFESDAIGFSGQPFYNMVAGLTCSHSVEQVTALLRNIEFKYGRCENAKKFSPRTLDLDLLLFDDLICESPAQLPRDEIDKNAFVLWPLSEIAPDLVHPILDRSYRNLWQSYDKTQQQLNIVDPCW